LDSLQPQLQKLLSTKATLIDTIRKPGGTTPNPAIPPITPRIWNPGINVGLRAIANLKLGVFVTRHYLRTSRLMLQPANVLHLIPFATFRASRTQRTPIQNLILPQPLKRLKESGSTLKTWAHTSSRHLEWPRLPWPMCRLRRLKYCGICLGPVNKVCHSPRGNDRVHESCPGRLPYRQHQSLGKYPRFTTQNRGI
jgi:hypothetical protein